MQKKPGEEIDVKLLQRVQEDFCKATRLCAYCLDVEGTAITEISGSANQIERVKKLMHAPQVDSALERVWGESLEDLAIEDLNADGDMVAAVAVRYSGRTLFYWIVFMITPSREGLFSAFGVTLDQLQDAGAKLVSGKFDGFRHAAEGESDLFADGMPVESYRNLIALARIVKLLDSSLPTELLLDNWLEIVCVHLDVDTAQIYRINNADKTMDVLCEWLNKEQTSIFERVSRLKIPRYLETLEKLVISSDTNDTKKKKYLKEWKLQALLQLPVISRENKGCLMLSLNDRKHHVWSTEETMFAEDSVRVLHNILKKRMQQEELNSSYQSLKMVLDHLGCSIYVAEAETGKQLFVNRMFREAFEPLLEDGSFEQVTVGENGALPDGGSIEIFNSKNERWYDLYYKEISWVDEIPARLYSLYDITDKKIYQSKIEQQANTDFLTGLYNRMCCERDLARLVDLAHKSGRTGALLYMDLDDFKHINDGLGHQYGDVLLKSIAHSLQRIKGIEESCYRMGGDEFVIVVSPDNYPEFDRIVEDIKCVFAKPWFLKESDYYCTMSMGSVTFPNEGDSVTDLVKKADIAMYEAKKGGKNRVVRYREGLKTVSGRQLDMERDMRAAAGGGCREFEVYYQPVIDIRENGRCGGAEALVRWNSPELGFIYPGEFIPLAEYMGLINPIGNYVLREACIQCRKWNENGRPDFRVNVNLSVVQLVQTDIASIVEKTVRETGINPANLMLEVTESLAINDMARMKEVLNRIRAVGVGIALDDFGTGYSSLNHIREIPFNLIKVDQSFVKELANDAYSQAFMKMIAELAGTLGVNICVEGIETKEQYDVVRRMKVRYIQGYYFDRPMKREDFEKKYVNV